MAAAAAAAGPAAAGAPSSLLLVVGGECGSPGLLAYVLEELERGIRSWGANGGVRSLDEELKVFVSRHSATFSSIVKGQRSLHHRGDALDTLVLLNPSDKSLSDELRNLLLDPAPHKLLVLAGPCLEETGELLLQTGGFSPHHFLQVLEDKEIQDILASTPPPADPATLTVTCPTFGDWVRLAPALPGLQGALRLRLLLNPPLPGPPPVSEGLREFLDYLAESLEPPSPFELLEPPSSGGFLRLARPCCYVFPGGLGDAAFFAVNGFTVLVNGGSNPKATFWKLVRHLDRVDAVLVTHAGADSLPGLNSLLRRKLAERREGAAAGGAAGSWDDRLRRLISPALGVVFLNARAAASRLVGGVDEAELALSLLAQLGVTPLALSRGPLPAKPLVLFEKMGVGRLDLYVLHPPAAEPAPAAASVCALLVWHPAGPADKLVRVLFPGCTPPARVLDGLGRLQHLGFLREPVVTPQDLDGPPRAASRESLGARDGRPGPERPAAAPRRAEKDARPARDAKKDPKAAGPRPQPQPREVRRAAAAAPGLKKSTPQAAPKPRRAAHAPQPLQNGPHSARGGGGREPGEQQPGAGAERGPRGEAAGAALERGLPAAAHTLALRDPRKPRRGQRAAVAEPAAARGGGARRLAHRDHAHADHALAARRGGLPALHGGGRVAVRVLRAGAAATQRAGRGGAEPPAARAPRAPLGLPARRGPVPRVALRVRAPQGRAAGALPGQLQRQQRALPGAGGRARGRGDAADVGQRVPAHAVRLGPPARRPRRRRLGRGHGGPGGGPEPRPSARAAQGAAAAAQPAQPLHGGPRDAAAQVGPAAGGRGPRTQSPGPARLPHRRAQGRTRDRRQEQGAGGRGPRRAAAQRPQRAQRQGGPGAPGQEVLSPQDGHPRPVRPRRQPARRLSRRARLPRLPGPGLPAQRERRAPGGRGVLPARARALLRHQRPGPAQGGGDARRAGRAAGRQGAVGPRAAGDPDPHLRLGGHAPLVRGHARPAPGAGRHGAGQQQHGVHAGRGLPRLQGRVLAPPPPRSPAPGNKAPVHPHPGLDASSGGTPGLGGLLPGPCNSRGAAGAPWR